MENVHLCLSDLLDQDLSSFEYFQTLPRYVQQTLQEQEIVTFEELQEHAEKIKASSIFG